MCADACAQPANPHCNPGSWTTRSVVVLSLKAMYMAVKLAVVVLLTVSAIVNIYTSVKLEPVVHNIDAVVKKANILYDLVYYFGCNASQVVPVAECALLRR